MPIYSSLNEFINIWRGGGEPVGALGLSGPEYFRLVSVTLTEVRLTLVFAIGQER